MNWLKEIDHILRGQATNPTSLQQGKIEVSPARLIPGLLGMGMLYGLCMASFSIFQGSSEWYMQTMACMLKVPALFLLTLLVTFPSLYVFSALVGSPLRLFDLFRLLTAALGVTMVVLASLGPIVAFFAMSTSNYHFMLLLNVGVFALCGLLGVLFLLQTLKKLRDYEVAQRSVEVEVAEEPSESGRERGRARPRRKEPVEDGTMLGISFNTVFRCWIIVYGLVGAQMGWVMRPFLGHPDLPFSWFRPRDSNFFEAVLKTIKQLVS